MNIMPHVSLWCFLSQICPFFLCAVVELAIALQGFSDGKKMKRCKKRLNLKKKWTQSKHYQYNLRFSIRPAGERWLEVGGAFTELGREWGGMVMQWSEIQRFDSWPLQSVCQSVHGQDAGPQIAPDRLPSACEWSCSWWAGVHLLDLSRIITWPAVAQ